MNAADRVQLFLDARKATAPNAEPGLAVTITPGGGTIRLLDSDVQQLVDTARKAGL